MRTLYIIASLVSLVLAAFQPTTFILSSHKLSGTPGRAMLRKRSLTQSSIPLQDYFNGTDLQ